MGSRCPERRRGLPQCTGVVHVMSAAPWRPGSDRASTQIKRHHASIGHRSASEDARKRSSNGCVNGRVVSRHAHERWLDTRPQCPVNLALSLGRSRASFASPHTILIRVLHGPAFRGRTEPRVVGLTSSRDQSGPVLVSIYPYPAHGGLGPVRGGSGCRRNNAFLCEPRLVPPVALEL